MELKIKNPVIELYKPWPMCIRNIKQHCNPNIIFGCPAKCKNCEAWEENYKQVLNDSIRREQNSDKKNNYHLIIEEVERDGGKYISFGNKSEDMGFLIGASATIEDYYWVYMNRYRKICFSSCVGGYKIIDEIPAEFSVLDYMRKHDKKSIKTIIDNFIKNMKYDKMITNVYY